MKKIYYLFAIILILLGAIPVKAADEEVLDFFPSATSTISYVPTFTSPSLEAKDIANISSPARILISEPKIRVGIYKTDKKVTFSSPFPYFLMIKGEYMGTLPEKEVATLTYENGVYSFKSSSFNISSTDRIRLEPINLSHNFVITNLDRKLSSYKQKNFNAYRGVFEYWYSAKSKMPYIINELYLEDYVAGIAETSSGAPEEYIKALQIAARTYAYSNISKSAPSIKNMFDVYASTVDQLYLGYNFESSNPKIAEMTVITRGSTVTYKGSPVPTYYFSRSNGKTKSSKTQPWLKSVEAKYDKGKSQYGHGYGMSNQDAMMRAKKDGWTSEQILTHYYSSVLVEKIY